MGSSIAEWLALAGIGVILVSRREEARRSLLDRVERFGARRARIGRMGPDERERRRRACVATPAIEELADAQVVIECAAEDLAVKRVVFQSLDGICRETTLLASNTSSLRISDIAAAAPRPERVIGMHFFQPVRFTRVTEVVPGNETSAEACAQAIAFLRRVDKLPVVVKETAGFLVNRMAGAYLAEAMHSAEEGASTAELDTALKAWGMGIGPFELADLIGLDVLQAIARNMEASHGPRFRPGPLLDELVRAGRLGRKVGRGIYEYGLPGGRHSGPPPPPASRGGPGNADGLARRVVGSLVEEARTCLREGIASAEAIDLAAIECLRMPRGPLEIAGLTAAVTPDPPAPRSGHQGQP
jgi:3-hydroxyacyl-CoA dehydrogenase